jgi:hypothetical protein
MNWNIFFAKELKRFLSGILKCSYWISLIWCPDANIPAWSNCFLSQSWFQKPRYTNFVSQIDFKFKPVHLPPLPTWHNRPCGFDNLQFCTLTPPTHKNFLIHTPLQIRGPKFERPRRLAASPRPLSPPLPPTVFPPVPSLSSGTCRSRAAASWPSPSRRRTGAAGGRPLPPPAADPRRLSAGPRLPSPPRRPSPWR